MSVRLCFLFLFYYNTKNVCSKISQLIFKNETSRYSVDISYVHVTLVLHGVFGRSNYNRFAASRLRGLHVTIAPLVQRTRATRAFLP